MYVGYNEIIGVFVHLLCDISISYNFSPHTFSPANIPQAENMKKYTEKIIEFLFYHSIENKCYYYYINEKC